MGDVKAPEHAARATAPHIDEVTSGFDTVLVLDFGAQYGQLIARRVRECHVYSQLVPFDTPLDEIRDRRPKGLILSGGPMSVYVDDAPRPDPALFSLGIPILGICYGAQLMALELGGTVTRTGTSEFGKTRLRIAANGTLLDGLAAEEQCWMSHRDCITAAPAGFTRLATSDGAPVAAMEHAGRGMYAVQFHPEVVHTPRGMDVLKNFLYEACDCTPTWTPASIIEEQVQRIREQVGPTDKAVLGLSGGVDSSVAAVLVHKAIGDRLTCVFIDQGMMRWNEAEHVVEMFTKHLRIPLIAVDARQRFLDKLVGVTDPERKRKIIGEEFIRCFEEEAAQAHRRALPRAGHPVLRRHRERHAAGGQDQEPPQRRRPAGEDGLRARRAAAPALQGRGARRGRGARPARAHRLAAAVPRARPRASASSARSRRSGSTSCSAPTPSCRTRSRRPASTASSGSASPSCPSSAASACRATSAPTPTRSPSAP